MCDLKNAGGSFKFCLWAIPKDAREYFHAILTKMKEASLRWNFRIYFIYVFIKFETVETTEKHTNKLLDRYSSQGKLSSYSKPGNPSHIRNASFTTKITVHLSANIPLMLNVDANCQCLFVIQKLGENYHAYPRGLDSDLKHSHLHQRDKRKGEKFAASPH